MTIDIQNPQPTATDSTDEEFTIIRKYVTPGHLDDEVIRLRDDQYRVWTRMHGESEQELIDRATREVPRNANGVGSLHAFGAVH